MSLTLINIVPDSVIVSFLTNCTQLTQLDLIDCIEIDGIFVEIIACPRNKMNIKSIVFSADTTKRKCFGIWNVNVRNVSQI
jgi:hypothetical protein